MDGVTVILGLIALTVLAVIVLWSTRNKGVVGKRVVVGESTPQIAAKPQDSTGETDPVDDWEIVAVTRTRRSRANQPASVSNASVSEASVSNAVSNKSALQPIPQPRLEPSSASLTAPQVKVTHPNADKAVTKASEPPSELIVVLNIIAHQQWLEGPRVINAVRNTGMQYSDPGIFHYVPPASPQDEPLFSLANMLNPGVFKMDELEQLKTPGVTLFMRLPSTLIGSIHGLDAFARMHDTARELAQMLNAEVCDEHRLTLTEVGVSQLRDKIAQHQGVH